MTATQQNITNLLRYAEEILKISERIVADLAKDAFLAVHEQDVLGLEGVTVDADDGSWVRFARLREVPTPPPDPMFDDWVLKPTAARIFEKPQLADSRLVKVSIEAASDLAYPVSPYSYYTWGAPSRRNKVRHRSAPLPRGDAEQRAKGIERVEAPVAAKREFVEVGL